MIFEEKEYVAMEPIAKYTPYNRSSKDVSDTHIDDEDTVCGIGSFRPKCLQKWATEKVFVVLYALICIIQGANYSYLVGTLSTLEKRFAFKSKISGAVLMMDEVTPLFSAVLVGYFGASTHRPRVVGVGMLLISACCFVQSLPYFIYGPAGGGHSLLANSDENNRTEFCHQTDGVDACDGKDEGRPTVVAVFCLMFGCFLKGFGCVACNVIGLAYLDDGAKKSNTPLYYGIVVSLRMTGPLLGHLMSSFLLKFNENLYVDHGYGPEDPRWIGCWWIGFIIMGVASLIFVVPVCLFPRRLPSNKISNAKPTVSDINFKGLAKALKRLMTNPVFVVHSINTIISIHGKMGHYTVLPKYMEHQFRLPAADANLFSGPPGILSYMIATVIGGFIFWKLRPSPKILTVTLMISELLAMTGYILLLFPQCSPINMAHSGYGENGMMLNMTCNNDCACSKTQINPVCDVIKDASYFSPCFAGCNESNGTGFSNCLCSGTSFVEKGYCKDNSCWSQALLYIIAMPAMYGILGIPNVANTLILLRSVAEEDKSLAIGTFETLICAFGFIPYPVFFGSLVDSACLIWEESCNRTGNCWFYNIHKFNYLMHGTSAGSCFLTFICVFIIFRKSARIRKVYED